MITLNAPIERSLGVMGVTFLLAIPILGFYRPECIIHIYDDEPYRRTSWCLLLAYSALLGVVAALVVFMILQTPPVPSNTHHTGRSSRTDRSSRTGRSSRTDRSSRTGRSSRSSKFERSVVIEPPKISMSYVPTGNGYMM